MPLRVLVSNPSPATPSSSPSVTASTSAFVSVFAFWRLQLPVQVKFAKFPNPSQSQVHGHSALPSRFWRCCLTARPANNSNNSPTICSSRIPCSHKMPKGHGLYSNTTFICRVTLEIVTLLGYKHLIESLNDSFVFSFNICSTYIVPTLIVSIVTSRLD